MYQKATEYLFPPPKVQDGPLDKLYTKQTEEQLSWWIVYFMLVHFLAVHHVRVFSPCDCFLMLFSDLLIFLKFVICMRLKNGLV